MTGGKIKNEKNIRGFIAENFLFWLVQEVRMYHYHMAYEQGEFDQKVEDLYGKEEVEKVNHMEGIERKIDENRP